MTMDFAQMQRRIVELEAERGTVLRFGIIVGVDEQAGSARVQLEDANKLVSYPLRVLQRRTLKGAATIILRTLSLLIQGLLGKACSAMMTVTFRLFGQLAYFGDYTQQGSHSLFGGVGADGSVMDSGGNTNHHSH